MPENSVILAEDELEGKKENQFVAVMKRVCSNKLALVALIVFAVIVLAAIFANFIAPYGYEEMDLGNTYQPPSLQHLCGTDQLGRDIFSRLLYGARYSLALGLLAQVFTLFFGVLLGAVAGFFGNKVDLAVMRFLDIFEAIPAMLLAIIICTALGTGFLNTVIAMGVGGIPMMSRLLRASILTVREQEYIEAAASINCSKPRQIMRYVLPNSISPLIIAFTTGIGATIMQAASLSYLGLGVQPPMPEWGAMLSDTRKCFQHYPYMAIFPGVAIAVTVLCINIVGDALRDALDPKLKD
ncbi:MAG: ABC transporter permease [Oscillospiraceae bacterium]